MTDTLVGRLQEALKQWWSFDDRQRHTHSWHTRTDFIYTELPKLVAPFEAEIERLTRERDEAEALAFKFNSGEEYQLLMRMNNDLLARALAAESSLSEAVKAAREDEREGCALVAENAYTGRTNTGIHPLQIASAIRSRAAVLEQK